MSFKLRSLVATTLAGTFLLGFGANAMADSTTDIVNALISKGVLTEEEGALLTKGHEYEKESQEKAMKKASKLSVSDAIDNATVYGDIRVRGELRSGDGVGTRGGVAVQDDSEDRTRGRYKLTLGVKTKASDFYSDLALAMGAGGRSDNATFAGGANANGANNKEAILVKRAMVGWNVTDWLALEAGRIANPLYTTPMVWDGDLTFEGLAEMVKFKAGPADIFLTAVQSQYVGDKKTFSKGTGDRATNEILAFQGGAKFSITDAVSAKAALTYTTYTNRDAGGIFRPASGTSSSLGANTSGINDLTTIEIPAEINFKATDTLGIKAFGDYVINLDGSDRYHAAVANTAAGAARNAISAAGNDDNAWMLGIGIDSKAGKKAQKGDWSAKLWYQDVGIYSVDPNAVDSDFMDSRVNMKGVVLKTGYDLRDNVVLNFAAGHGSRKNNDLSAAGYGNDIALNLKSFDLYQLDLTYKF
ncbi:MAG: putative porin [Methylotenera sp.]